MSSPLYLRLADLLETMIERRSLRSGDRIPSVRQFSREQRVSVPTALNAYATLETRGLIEARPKSGFYVRARELARVPAPQPASFVPKISPPRDNDPLELLMRDLSRPDLVQFGGALPSPDILPGARLARVLSAVARREGAAGAAYDLGPGLFALRREIARRYLAAGCSLGPDDLIITVGGTEALAIAIRAVSRPGDTVAVESPTFFGILRQLRELGLNALPIPVHPTEGMDLDALALALRRTRISACIVVPNFNNPVGYVMPDARKKELLRLAVSHRFSIIEDDAYGELPHRGPRPHCLKALDEPGVVLLCGSFSKILAPGYRIGFIAPGPWMERALVIKKSSTLSGVRVTAAAVAEFLRNGGYDRFLRSFREALRRQVERMQDAIAEAFPPEIGLSRPQGGFVLWCELPRRVDGMELFHRARAAGISIAPGHVFGAEAYVTEAGTRTRQTPLVRTRGSSASFRNYVRINCGAAWSPKIEQSIGVLGHMVRELARGP